MVATLAAGYSSTNSVAAVATVAINLVATVAEVATVAIKLVATVAAG